MYRPNLGVSEKCIGCYPRIEGKEPMSGGIPWETRCMASCVGKIRLQGLVEMNEDGSWKKDPENPLYHLIQVEKVALPLYPQFGTEPNGYYIPPRWVHRGYLRQMFGPGVDAALERYTAPSRELLAVLQLFRATQAILFKFKIEPGKKVFETTMGGKPWALYNDTVIGYGRDGKELVRTTVEEPIHVRKQPHPEGSEYPKHANSI
jgi:nitrate reductase beta subunit